MSLTDIDISTFLDLNHRAINLVHDVIDLLPADEYGRLAPLSRICNEFDKHRECIGEHLVPGDNIRIQQHF